MNIFRHNVQSMSLKGEHMWYPSCEEEPCSDDIFWKCAEVLCCIFMQSLDGKLLRKLQDILHSVSAINGAEESMPCEISERGANFSFQN